MAEVLKQEIHSAIEKLLDDCRIKDYSIDLKPGSVLGDNYLGVITSVTVEGLDEAGKKEKLNWIVKSSQQNEEFRDMFNVHHAFKREIYAYSRLFPVFEEFQKGKNLRSPFRSVAKMHRYTLENTSESLIMENMKELGYRLCNRLEPLDYHHTSLVMKEYGRLHALSFALRDQRPEIYQKLVEDCKGSLFHNFDKEKMMEIVEPYFDGALKCLDPDKDAHIIEKLKICTENPIDVLLQLGSVETAGKHSVLVHGDCWMNNILFKYGKPEHPKEPTNACFLDWQLMCAASPVLDISYFIYANTDKKLRDEHYIPLLDQYYESFSSFLRELGSDPQKLFPREAFQDHLKKFSLYGLTTSLMVTKLMLAEQDETCDFSKMSQEERISHGKKEIKNAKAYEDRIRDIIRDFYRLGYLEKHF